MNRRKFFSNLVGSVSVLVSAYALPFQKIKRIQDTEFADVLRREGFEGFDVYWHKTPLTQLFKKEPWPENMGETFRRYNQILMNDD